jgi:hypothetical protein
MQQNRPIQTRFRSGFTSLGLTLKLHTVTRRLIKQKARSQTLTDPKVIEIVLLLLVSMRFQELFHSPHWGTFHLSLTVLVHYRSQTTI